MVNAFNRFSIEAIDSRTYAIRELYHSEETNSYLLIGANYALLIDAGMGISNIKDIVESITNKPIMLIITHAHWDHIGSVNEFENVFIHKNEKLRLKRFPLSIERVRKEILNTAIKLPNEFDIAQYILPTKGNVNELIGNEIINLGDRTIKIILTPDHSPGSVSIFEESTGYLFSGDLIYKGQLDCYYESTNSQLYEESLLKLKNEKIKYIFGGHHDLFIDGCIIEDIYEAFHLINNNSPKLISTRTNDGHSEFFFKNFSIKI